MGICFRALFWTPLDPEALATLRPLLAPGTSSGLFKYGSLAGVWSYDSISMTAGTEGTVTG